MAQSSKSTTGYGDKNMFCTGTSTTTKLIVISDLFVSCRKDIATSWALNWPIFYSNVPVTHRLFSHFSTYFTCLSSCGLWVWSLIWLTQSYQTIIVQTNGDKSGVRRAGFGRTHSLLFLPTKTTSFPIQGPIQVSVSVSVSLSSRTYSWRTPRHHTHTHSLAYFHRRLGGHGCVHRTKWSTCGWWFPQTKLRAITHFRGLQPGCLRTHQPLPAVDLSCHVISNPDFENGAGICKMRSPRFVLNGGHIRMELGEKVIVPVRKRNISASRWQSEYFWLWVRNVRVLWWPDVSTGWFKNSDVVTTLRAPSHFPAL